LGTFVEQFASRHEFEEWLAAAGDRVKVRNVSMATRRAGEGGGDTSYTVTYEADSEVARALPRLPR